MMCQLRRPVNGGSFPTPARICGEIACSTFREWRKERRKDIPFRLNFAMRRIRDLIAVHRVHGKTSEVDAYILAICEVRRDGGSGLACYCVAQTITHRGKSDPQAEKLAAGLLREAIAEYLVWPKRHDETYAELLPEGFRELALQKRF